jgi:hypothetical protein
LRVAALLKVVGVKGAPAVVEQYGARGLLAFRAFQEDGPKVIVVTGRIRITDFERDAGCRAVRTCCAEDSHGRSIRYSGAGMDIRTALDARPGAMDAKFEACATRTETEKLVFVAL